MVTAASCLSTLNLTPCPAVRTPHLDTDHLTWTLVSSSEEGGVEELTWLLLEDPLAFDGTSPYYTS